MKTRSRVALWCALAAPVSLSVPLSSAVAQDAAGDLPASNAETPAPENATRAATLIGEALALAERNTFGRFTEKQKMVRLTGNDAIEYMYKRHWNAQGQTVQFYKSVSNGRIYYRDPQTHQAIYATAPRGGIMVPDEDQMMDGTATSATSRVRAAVVRGAAALLPRLAPEQRDTLTMRWMRLIQAPSSGLPRDARLDAYESFFEAAARVQGEDDFARRMALSVPDNAARAGALLQLSRASERTNYARSLEYSRMARVAAHQESDATERARALTFVAYRMTVQPTENTDAALHEATAAARALKSPRERDYLLAEIVGAASNYDLPMARRIAGTIRDEKLRGLATARTNIAEASQTTLSVATTERISTLAKAAARYDVRAIPILIQLPAQADVLKTLSKSLPPIYLTARPAISPALLERMWTYSTTATETGASRDELQSRLARLMVLHDLWRGRDWGKQLAWKGGRVQVGAFLKQVLMSRQSQVRAMPLQDVAKRNVDAAIAQARGLENPASRAEALLLIAGQLLG